MSFTNGPKDPCLVLLTGKGAGTILPIGANFIIIADPEKADRQIPVVLVKVTRDVLAFRCNCGEPSCTRVMEYRLKVKGHHPSQ